MTQSTTSPTMKEAFISPNCGIEIRDVPIPSLKAGEVLVKVIVSGTNPKDWKMPVFLNQALNSGDDVAGVVQTVGDGVFEFKPGDRVAAMHQIGTEHGSFAEYAVAPASTTFHIPDTAATIPLASLVAAFGLYHVLGLPAPWSGAGSRIQSGPLVIHGAGTAIGALAIKLARASDIHPIIATAGNSSDFVLGLLDIGKGDAVVDYRQPQDELAAEIQAAISKSNRGLAWYGLDCATNQDGSSDYNGVLKTALGTQAGLEEKTDRKPLIATVQMGAKFSGSVEVADINVMLAHIGTQEQQCLAYTVSRLFSYGLAKGWLTGHPTEVVEGGLQGVAKALQRLKDGQVFGKKLVVKVGDE